MKHIYEQKVFIFGLSEMLQNDILPQDLRPLLSNLLTQLINTMLKLTKAEEYELQKKAKKEINEDDSEKSDDEDDDDYSDDEENEEENDSDDVPVDGD